MTTCSDRPSFSFFFLNSITDHKDLSWCSICVFSDHLVFLCGQVTICWTGSLLEDIELVSSEALPSARSASAWHQGPRQAWTLSPTGEWFSRVTPWSSGLTSEDNHSCLLTTADPLERLEWKGWRMPSAGEAQPNSHLRGESVSSPRKPFASIFVSHGCWNKWPQTGWFKTAKICSHTVLEARSPRLIVSGLHVRSCSLPLTAFGGLLAISGLNPVAESLHHLPPS